MGSEGHIPDLVQAFLKR